MYVIFLLNVQMDVKNYVNQLFNTHNEDEDKGYKNKQIKN